MYCVVEWDGKYYDNGFKAVYGPFLNYEQAENFCVLYKEKFNFVFAEPPLLTVSELTKPK